MTKTGGSKTGRKTGGRSARVRREVSSGEIATPRRRPDSSAQYVVDPRTQRIVSVVVPIAEYEALVSESAYERARSGSKIVALMEAPMAALDWENVPGAGDLEPADGDDLAAIVAAKRRLATGEDELVPGDVAKRLMSGESRVRIWREYRGLSQAALARAARVPQANLSQIETGARGGNVETLQRIARVLDVALDDVAPLPPED